MVCAYFYCHVILWVLFHILQVWRHNRSAPFLLAEKRRFRIGRLLQHGRSHATVIFCAEPSDFIFNNSLF